MSRIIAIDYGKKRTGIAVSGMHRPLFMSYKDMPELLTVIEGVVYVQDGPARISKYGINALFLQTFYDDLCSC